jgi:hypothetical protein
METTNYMIFGFFVIFAVLFVHIASFSIRNRNLFHDLEMLEGLQRKPSKKKTKRDTSRRPIR